MSPRRHRTSPWAEFTEPRTAPPGTAFKPGAALAPDGTSLDSTAQQAPQTVVWGAHCSP